MGDTKLCLLLLLSTYALAQQDVVDSEGQIPTCLVARRFQNFKRYVYDYEAETHNGVNGATIVKNGPKVYCKVEVDAVQTCSFIVRTSECSLSEIVDVGPEGSPVFGPSADSDSFRAAMATNPLKVMVEGGSEVKLFPEESETTTILNIKRGIVSALLVPLLKKKNAEMATLHGVCETDITINAGEDVATDLTLTRDLSKCDSFTPHREHTSPLALISGMHLPLSKLISSTQTCNYRFSTEENHMVSGTCTEKHIYLPFSHQNEYGVGTTVKQTLTLVESENINDRVFSVGANLKFLPMEAVEDKTPTQNKDSVVATMRELNSLSQTSQGHQRASTFQKLVSQLRGLKAETMSALVDSMMTLSGALTWQALAQCGTPECSSGMLQVLRTFDTDAVEVDAAVYALGMLPNPSRLLVKDMLAMAQYKQSKAIMYALSNAVRKLYQAEGEVTPEITAVSEFMTSILGADCAGEKELTFMTLRVVGNMGKAMEAADASVKTTLLKCMRQPTTTLSVQLAAIQAFRGMTVTSEVRANLQRVSQYGKGAVQKRLAAYLILMRDPEASDLELVRKVLIQEQNAQVKAFVTSHLYNIISSKDPETQKLGKKIVEVMGGNDVTTHGDYTTMARNYKMETGMDNLLTGMKGNVIFDPSSQLPREVMFETTLNAFGFDLEMMEVGMEGKGFDPTVELLFGKNGFFPDTLSKTMYWAADKMPDQMNEVLEKWAGPLRRERQKRQVPENIVREIVRNVNKLAKDLQAQETPEATAYLRIMGAELGYIKGSDLKGLVNTAVMYADVLFRIIPTKTVEKLMSGTDNELFAHYIFMDNSFTLPTAAGFPLKFSLSGTFVPGAKGGLRIAPNMQEVSFMPSVGVEFVTQMGVHIPEFVVSAIEMHTNMYHESALHAKITLEKNQVKLSIPAPQGTTQLFRVSNRVLTVTTDKVSLVPPMDENQRTNAVSCSPLFSGVKLCTTARYSIASGNAAPYFPLNGETKFAVDIQPTGLVSEYTATISYELLHEGKEGQHMVDSLKMSLRAEGSEPTEATATMKYNRNRRVFTTSVQIPDYDVEAGLRVGLADSSTKGKSLTITVSNKNVPQLSLIGRAKMEDMTDGLLQVQLLVPSLKTDAAVTATLRNAEGLTLAITSDIKLPETSSVQGVTFKYGEDEVEVQLMSDMNTEIQSLLPSTAESIQNWLVQLSEDILDQKVVKTDMKLRHIYTKALEASNIWLGKIIADVPAIETLKSRLPEVVLPSMPDKLFLKSESTFKYQFNKDRVTITIPMPFGGKSSEELRIPARLTTPHLTMPQMGLELPSREIQVPTFSIPSGYDITLPLFGMVEASAKVNSNYYNWDAMLSAGNNSVESPSYVAKYKVVVDSPIELLSYTTEGTALIADIPEDSMKAIINASLNHKLIDTSFDITESVIVSDKVRITGNYKIQAFSPLGLQTSLEVTSQCSLDTDIFIGDANMDGSVTIGPMAASTTYSQSFSVEPMKKEARGESMLRLDAPMLEFVNKIKAGYADEKLLIESNTNMNNDPIKHTTKFSIGYKEAQLTIQSDSVTKADEKMLRSQVDFTVSRNEASIRVENQADDTENRAYSLLSVSLDPSSIEVNADASINVLASRASHKATLTLNKDGLATSCTTTAQSSPVTFENVIHSGVDTTGASITINTKGAIQENTAELTVEGKASTSEIYMNSMYKGNLFDADTRNRVNFRINEDGLFFSNSLVASVYDMKTDNTHSMTLHLGSLAIRSKTDNIISDRNSYKHDVKVDVEHFTASVVASSDVKIMDVSFVNEAQFMAEPYKMELTGSVKGAYSEQEMMHTYEFSFADMTASAKCHTNGKLMGSQMSHNTDIELAGLSMTFNSMANFNSAFLRLDNTIHAMAEPFTLNVDAIFNSNGELNLYGKQSGEVYSKFLLKAKPLALSHSHECRASTTHQLESGTSFETNMNNKFNSLITTQEQSLTLKMTSKLNNHAVDHEVIAYNNPEKIGVEMKGAVSTTLLNKASENQDYSISGFVKYDKNSDSHLLQIPFIEHLPAVFEQVTITVMGVMDNSIELLKDIDTKYEIRAKLQDKVNELKQVIDTFDMEFFIQDIKLFINSVVDRVTGLMARLPHREFSNMVKSLKDTISDLFVKYNIFGKLNVIYNNMEEILSNYEVEKMVETIMDEVVEMMKQYHVRERIQSAIAALKSIDVQGLVNKVMAPVKEIVNQLSAFDFKQLFDDMSVYFDKLVEKIKSFDYDTFTEELREKVTEMTKIPCFGKLHGEFRIISPDYSLRTTAELQNSTTDSESPELTANLISQATSTSDLLAYTLDATAHVVLHKMSQLALSETMKIAHTAFSVDHEGAVNFQGLSAEASSKTTTKATTEPYKAELVSNAFFTTRNGVSATLENVYTHETNMPRLGLFSETSRTQKAVALLDNGAITLTLTNEGKGKFEFNQFVDEGTQKSDMEVVINSHDIKLTFTGSTNTNNINMKQNVNAEFCIYGHIAIDASAETKTPFITSSVATLKGEARVRDLKIEITASHNTDLVGNIEGTLSNSVTALVTPYELMFDTKNKENAKVRLPFTLSGKIDLQNDFAITLNSGVQQASWVGLARFNQYKYSHYFSMDNGEKEIHIFAQMNGEANLDVLKEPFTIPAMTVPFIGVTTPAVEDYSLWQHSGLGLLLITTQQTFDMDSKVVYKKNPEMFTIDLDLQPIFSAINKNSRMLTKNVIIGRDKVVAFLTTSVDQVKAEYEKYNTELPKTLTVPAYKIPVINVDVSSFSIPLPDASLITMPSLHVPSALSKLTVPKITLPRMQRSIKIPLMGDLTYEFSMKTPTATLKADAAIINQDNIVVRFAASSDSKFNVLRGNIEATSTLNRDNGVKLSSVLSVKHILIGGNHDSSVILNSDGVDASVTNSGYVSDLMEVNQELFANAQEGLVVSVSCPSTGLLGFQLQRKHSTQVKGRLYGRFPSDPANDVDIVAVKVSVIDSAVLNIQTTWNMEVPNEMMLGLKEKVPAIVSTLTLEGRMPDTIDKIYNEIIRMSNNLLDKIMTQGRTVFKRAVDMFEDLGLTDLTNKVSDSVVFVLREYEQKIRLLFNAAIEFLREIKIQLPGFEDKLSGLEVYQKFSAFVADVTEEAITKVPEFFAARSQVVRDSITEIRIPTLVFGEEEFEVLMITFEEFQQKLSDIVQSLGVISLEDIVEKLSEFNRICVQKVEELNWMVDVYTDALSYVTAQVVKFRRMAEKYFSNILTKVQDLFDDMSIEQLSADIQAWIDSMVKSLNAFHNKIIEFLSEITQKANSFVKVYDGRIEIDITPFSDEHNL